MSTYRTHPYQGAAKETSRLMLRLGNGCDELNVATGNRFMQETCANAISTGVECVTREDNRFARIIVSRLAKL